MFNLSKVVMAAKQGATAKTISIATEAATKIANEGIREFTSAFKGTGISSTLGAAVLKSSTGNVLGNLGSDTSSQVPSNLIPGANASGVTKLSTNELKVRIAQYPVFGNLPNELIFDVMPQIDESRQVDYDALQLVHHPGPIQKYRSTGARSWSIRGKLITRNRAEATKNLDIINMVRSWGMPFYGEGTAQNGMTSQYLGAPPPILTFSGYGPKMIGPVKCVLQNYSWDWANDVDWLPTYDNNPFPVLLNLNLSLIETWSPDEFSGFDIIKYRNGELPNAFDGSVARSAALRSQQAASPASSNSISTSEPSSIVQSQVKSTPIRQFDSVEHASQYLQALGQKVSVPRPNALPTGEQLRSLK